MKTNNNNLLQTNTNKTALIFLSICSVLLFAFILSLFFLTGSSENSTGQATVDTSGKQVITLTAKGGYSPKVITAESGKATLLNVKTDNTFDCSSGFTIPSLKISKNLPASGTTSIEIPSQPAGSEINGTCTMGMYNFKIKFI